MKANQVVLGIGALLLALEGLAGPCRIKFELPTTDPALLYARDDMKRLLGDVPATVRFVIKEKAPHQAWGYETKGDGSVEFRGADGVSLAFGVFSFLEREIGVGWYAADCEVVPADAAERFRKLLDGPAKRVAGRPKILDERSMYVAKDYISSDWRFHNKETGHATRFYPGVRQGSPRAEHTFEYYAGKLKAAHPELFNADRKDERGRPCGTLCMTDETTRDFIAEEICRTIESDRTGKFKDVPPSQWPSVYELSQDDGASGAECMCPNCRRLFERAGNRYSGPMIAFVSAVADRVKKVHPEIRIRTFAYSYTDLPPQCDLRAPDNVIVRYCKSNFMPPQELVPGSPNGKLFEEWKAHASNFSIWSYWKSYAGKAFPAVLTRARIGAEIRYCADSGVCQYFAENEGPMAHAFAMLQHWLFLKLTDDPYQDVFALSERFMRNYYGAAAGPMTRYLDWLEQHQDPNAGHLTREFYEKTEAWFDEAERLAAGDAAALRHIHWERVIVDRSLFHRLDKLQKAGYAFDRKKVSDRFAVHSMELMLNWGPVSGSREERIEATRLEAELFRHYPITMPKEFEGREAYPMECIEMVRSYGKIVEDPDAAAGQAYWIKELKAELPYALGCYSNRLRKGQSLNWKTMDDVPQDEKFHLHRIGTMMAPSDYYFWLDRTWNYRFYAASVGIVPEEFEVWISVKFQGPAFVRGSTKENRVLFDRAFQIRLAGDKGRAK